MALKFAELPDHGILIDHGTEQLQNQATTFTPLVGLVKHDTCKCATINSVTAEISEIAGNLTHFLSRKLNISAAENMTFTIDKLM